MRILSIDTATKVMGVALADDNKLIGEACLNVGKTHSQRLLPLLAALLENAELDPSQIDAVAVTSGPGSFTGLRIGIATAKALAKAWQRPVIPVCTLDALAYNARHLSEYICPVLDARKSQLYSALYNSEASRLENPCAVTVAELAASLQHKGGRVLFLGDGAEAAFPFFKEALAERALLMPKARRLFIASSVAELALKEAKAGNFMMPEQLKAFYLRASEAEVKKKVLIGK
jgi:tRNA threonylcarbamoyladenosine biosynthesis protein TsaB